MWSAGCCTGLPGRPAAGPEDSIECLGPSAVGCIGVRKEQVETRCLGHTFRHNFR